MTPSLRLGKIFGIEIGANWSLVFVFGLIAWTLAGSVFPVDVPGQSQGAYWLTGIAGAVLFYCCLLAHELAHALVARAKGVTVSGITMWLFGGVSRLSGEPPNAGAEALLTAVGPLTSVGVAAISYGVAVALSSGGAPGLVQDLFAWLAYLNAVLAVFNLIPAFPLDGGRLLAAFFWWRSGTRREGVHRAVRVGRVFAYLMILAGAVEIFTGAVLNGVWIVFVGWFLLTAAAGEEAATETRLALRDVPVSAAMSSPVVTVPDWYNVQDFLAQVAPQYHFTSYPLHDPEGKLSGLVRLTQLVRLPHADRAAHRLRDLAHPLSEVPTARPEESLVTVIERAGDNIDLRILVFDASGALVGILSPADVARVMLQRSAGRPGPASAS